MPLWAIVLGVFLYLVAGFILLVITAWIAELFGGLFEPYPIDHFREWKNARAVREATSESDFEAYRQACVNEKKYAIYTLKSWAFMVCAIFYPIAVPLLALYAVSVLLWRLVKILSHIPSLLRSAKGF
jgi:hypothetical protein